MALLTLQDVSIRYGGAPLLDGACLNVERGDRACLIGRNGAGKSTLLKILAGQEEPDSGEVLVQKGLRVAYMPQDVPGNIHGTVRGVVESGGSRHADVEHWEHADSASQVMSRLGLEPEAPFETQSGGLKRRALLARALVCEPDVLLLDEPTNHLDIASISWMEGFLARRVATFLFVTHDRAFLARLATRIVDLDRGAIVDWRCDYATFLQRKQQVLNDEAAEWEKKGKQLSREEVWIRQGIKARRTRDEGRVRALKALREEFRRRRVQEGVSRLALGQPPPSGRLVICAENVSFGYPGADQVVPLICDLNLRVGRGERLGLVGPNGAGKTTLLKLLTGELTPSRGSIKLGTRLTVSHFDQLRSGLDENRTVAQNLADDSDTVPVNGVRRNVFGYLQEFLFPPERAKTPVRVLSGGERSRLLLAKLFMEPGNLLVMDEPTNDLDIETLELLEEQLQLYKGTLLLVSHDRAFLNNVVTGTLVIEGNGRVGQYAGGYDDWLAQSRVADPGVSAASMVSRPSAVTRNTQQKRFGFKEKHELKHIGPRIEALEREQSECHAQLSDPACYQRAPEQQMALQTRCTDIERELEHLVERWAELETLQS